MKQRILIIDDDARHRNLLANLFETNGFDTLEAANAIEMQKQRERFHCDLLLLDINMPGEDGVSICYRLRDGGDMTPIMFLTGRDHVNDRVLGLNFGADDYLVKPFESIELIARVRVILRRVAKESLKVQETNFVDVQFGDFKLNTSSHSLLRNERIIAISFDEFKLLQILTSTPGITKSRSQLAFQIKGIAQDNEQRYIDKLVSRLRIRLKDDSSQIEYIQTVRGVGYVFKNAFPNQILL